jgi:phosphoribosyl 1,2-cyclic phosphodiesterase
VETPDGLDLVFDCGSGFRNCARDLQEKWADRDQRHLHLFGSHSHLDHTEGFDQAAVCFDPRNTIHVYSNRQYLRALDQYLGIFSKHVTEEMLGVQTPIFFGKMPATFEAFDIRDMEHNPPPAEGDDPLGAHYHDLGEPLRFAETTISMVEVFHPAPCLAYRIDHGGKAFIFCTDHELFHGEDEDDPRHGVSRAAEDRLAEMATGADLMYRDGQFFRAEYDGYQGIGSSMGVQRVGWGHSCIEDVMEMAERCAIARTHIGHHDPNRDWSERNWIDEALARRSAQTGLGFELAQAENVIEL